MMKFLFAALLMNLSECSDFFMETFDQKLFLYGEDVDMAWKIIMLGYKIGYADSAISYHDEGHSSSAMTPFKFYYITRNRLFFGLQYVPFRAKLALVKESIVLLIKGRSWQKRGILDFYLGKLGRGSFII